MKKIIVIACALLAIASCTKAEKKTADQTRISFEVINYLQQTKAISAYTGTEFGTYAYWTPTDWATNGDVNLFMKNDRIIQSPTYAPAGEWGPESERFWPKTGKITFASYSPYCGQAGNGFSEVPTFSKANGFVFRNYTIVAGTNVDLMVADLAVDQTENDPEYMLSGNKDGVPTLFRHVLSQIAFQFKTVGNPNPNVEDSQVVINEVKVKAIENKGTYTQNNDPEWAGQSGSASYEFNPATGNSITLNPDDTDAKTTQVPSRIVLPQELTEAVQQVEITYTIRTKYESNTEWAEETVTTTADLLTTTVDEWEPNQSVVYTITISPVSDDPILFDPAVASWAPITDNTLSL